MVRPFSSEIRPIFVQNFREKASAPPRDFGQELFFFRFWMDFFDGRFWNRRRRRRCRRPRPSCKEKGTFIYPVANYTTAKTGPFFSFMMAGKIYFAFRLSAGFFAVLVAELVILVNSQSISSFVVEFTIIKLPITFITIVVVPSFDRKTSNWLLIPWNMVQYTI